MATELRKIELDITEEIINIGLSKAADSLSYFIKEKVLIQLLDMKVNTYDYAPISKKDGMNLSYLLTTDIKGDVNGKAYLIFNEWEADKLTEVNLPSSILNNPIERKNMGNAILLEMDNIITASVVTQFANILRLKLHGDVPKLDLLQQDHLNPFLTENSQGYENIIYFNSRFITKSLDINPEFIWLMDNNFFSSVINVVSNDKNELLKKMGEV